MPERGSESADTLKYVCDMLEQLKVLAGASGGPFLVYLLDMAKTEAAERLRTTMEPRAASKKVGSGQH